MKVQSIIINSGLAIWIQKMAMQRCRRKAILGLWCAWALGRGEIGWVHSPLGLDLYYHDTYFLIAPLHLWLFLGTLLGCLTLLWIARR